jgi:hypothetical protein
MTDEDVYRLYALTFAKLKSGGLLKDQDLGPELSPRDLRGVVAIALAAEDAASGALQSRADVIPRVNELSGRAAPDYYNG